jgi:uncharacterized membrane protein
MKDAQEEQPMSDPSGKPVRKRHGFLHRLRAYFLAGILITAPVAITLAVASWLITFVDSRIVHLIPAQWNPDTYLKDTLGVEVGLPGLGLLILLIVITLIGWLTASYLGRSVVGLGENIVARMPVIRSVYGAIKQIFETVLAHKSQAFRQAVLVEYPRRGLWTVAFVTGETEGEVQSLTKEDVVSIYVPTTPNPTSGFLLFVPREDIVDLHMSVEEAIKYVISGGIVTPDDSRPEELRNGARVSARTYDQRSIGSPETDAADEEPPVLPAKAG